MAGEQGDAKAVKTPHGAREREREMTSVREKSSKNVEQALFNVLSLFFSATLHCSSSAFYY